MSIETIFLIATLTLLAVCLGVSLCWLAIVQIAIQSTLDRVDLLALIATIRLPTIRLMAVIFVVTLICAIALNIIDHSRSEPYLLKIGLISLILSLLSLISKFMILDSIAIAGQLSLINNSLLWINLLCITVSYWSFLHYALNPKITNH
ncbi:MAG: hypothetical protein AAFQ80_11145 [Cyanobacteria bacterium J06621_8]